MAERRTGKHSLTVKGRAAVAAGLVVRRVSRMTGRGAGGMFGGKIALAINPDVIDELAAAKQCVLVTGTNGKSTTTKMTVAALETLGPVAANLGGDNMPTGIATALMLGRTADFAVLEVDEMNMPAVAAHTRPAAIILLNLSRDQLDRVGEIGVVERRLRRAVEDNPQARIIANCDDPLIASAAWGAPNISWVAAGAPWKDDASAFPRTGTLVERDGDDWLVEGHPEYRRPRPDWTVTSVQEDGSYKLDGPEGISVRVRPAVPGRANRGNSAQAIAAAVSIGADPQKAAGAVAKVDAVAGRYQTYDVDGRATNLLLAKNPAGWQESQTAMRPDTTQVVVAVNGQGADGADLSWLWDVDFTPLKELGATRIMASGERAADLAVRLAYDDIDAELIENPLAAIRACDRGPVQVLANYTAFRDLKKEIDKDVDGKNRGVRK